MFVKFTKKIQYEGKQKELTSFLKNLFFCKVMTHH